MRRISAFTILLVVTATIAPLRAQQELKRRPGTVLIYGPVHTIRDERAAVTKENGNFVEGPRVLVMTLTYSEDGTKQDRTLYHAEVGIIHRAVDTYDPDGRILETSLFRGNGILEVRTVSVFNGQKQLIERIAYRPDGSMSTRTVFRRDGNLTKSETVRYDTRGVIVGQSTTTNDLQAKQAESISINPAGIVQTQAAITNNPDGSQEFRQERSNGDFQREVVSSDQNGTNERILYNRDGTIRSRERYVREFDSYHNLTKTTRSVAKGDSPDFEPIDVTYRAITYYGKD